MKLGTPHKTRIERILKELRKTLSADVLRRAEIILSHEAVNDPEGGAIALLTKANNGKEYPGVSNAIALCAACNDKSLDPPPIINDRRTQRKYAGIAQDLLAQVEQYSKFMGGSHGFRYFAKRFKGSVPEVNPPDAVIVLSLQLVADVFRLMADRPKKVGRHDDLGVRNVVCLLEDQFRRDFGTPHYGIIGRFWEATFPDTSEKDAETVRVTISKFRRS